MANSNIVLYNKSTELVVNFKFYIFISIVYKLSINLIYNIHMFERQLLLDYLPSLTKQMAADQSNGSFGFSYDSCKKIYLYFFSFVKSDKIMSKFKNELLLLRKLQQK